MHDYSKIYPHLGTLNMDIGDYVHQGAIIMLEVPMPDTLEQIKLFLRGCEVLLMLIHELLFGTYPSVLVSVGLNRGL